MAQLTLIDGTGYEINSNKPLVDGTAYEITKGRTLIDGTGYDINFLPNPLIVFDGGTSLLYGKITTSTNGSIISGNLRISLNGSISGGGVNGIIRIGGIDLTKYSRVYFTGKRSNIGVSIIRCGLSQLTTQSTDLYSSSISTAEQTVYYDLSEATTSSKITMYAARGSGSGTLTVNFSKIWLER